MSEGTARNQAPHCVSWILFSNITYKEVSKIAFVCFESKDSGDPETCTGTNAVFSLQFISEFK
jgi:hypothetical protein